MTKWIFVFAIIFLASADDMNDLNDTAINKLPEEFVPSGTFENLEFSLRNMNSTSVKLLKEKCEDINGNSESFDNVMRSKIELRFCIRNLLKANPFDDHTVGIEFCRLLPQLRYCGRNFTSSMEPCLYEMEKGKIQVANNITDALLSFMCFKEGERIELFIAEGGPDCLIQQEKAVVNCMISLFSKFIPKDVNAKCVPSLKLEEVCRDINTLQKCIVTELTKCKKPTPANIIDSLFNSVIKVTPCSKYS